MAASVKQHYKVFVSMFFVDKVFHNLCTKRIQTKSLDYYIFWVVAVLTFGDLQFNNVLAHKI